MPFDLSARATGGEPVKVVETVDYEPPGQAAFTVAGHVLVYRARPASADRDESRGSIAAAASIGAVDMPPGSFRSLSITPDDRLATIDRRDAQGLSSVWVLDLGRGTSSGSLGVLEPAIRCGRRTAAPWR